MKKSEINSGDCVVNHWQNRRGFAFTSNKVGLEVSAGFCECSTCSARYASFLYTLQRKEGVKYSFEYYEYSYKTMGCGTFTYKSRWVVLELPEGKDPIEFLQETLDVTINDVKYYQKESLPDSLKV